MADKRQTPIVPPHESHGNSVAAWTAVSIIAIGFLLVAIAWVRTDIPLYLAGAIVIIAGGIAGKVLSAMGFGASHKPGH
jgi:hypothetical protein